MAEMWINMGPQHPMTHGLWNLRVRVDGETIVEAEPELGYLHRGVEKLVEHRSFTQVIPFMDRLCYASSLTWSHCYVLAAETLLEAEVPERAKYLRVIGVELQRLASHLMWLAAYAPDLGNLTMFLYAMREREYFLDLLEMMSGARMNQNYPRIGGVARDVPPGFDEKCLKILDLFETRMLDYRRMLEGSKVFLMRTQDLGYISREDAMNWGITGPNLRGSGTDFDLRAKDPYEVYEELDFQPQWEKEGDCLARYLVRMNEMTESCRLIREALKKMPKSGPVLKKPKLRAPEGAEAMRRTEDSRGEALMHIIGGGTDRPYRLKIRSPIFVSVSSSCYYLIGYKVADVPAILGSIDMCIGETDR